MKKEPWLDFQREILEARGYFKLFSVLFVLTHVIMGDDRFPVLAYFPQFSVEAVGVVLLTIVFFVGKSVRTKKESRTIVLYWILLLLATGVTLFRML